MAKKALVEKNKKRKVLSQRYREKRIAIKEAARDKSLSVRDRMKLYAKLNKLPVDSSQSRVRNRCSITGRPRGFYRRFGLSRIKLRDMAGWGILPGVIKSSW